MLRGDIRGIEQTRPCTCAMHSRTSSRTLRYMRPVRSLSSASMRAVWKRRSGATVAGSGPPGIAMISAFAARAAAGTFFDPASSRSAALSRRVLVRYTSRTVTESMSTTRALRCAVRTRQAAGDELLDRRLRARTRDSEDLRHRGLGDRGAGADRTAQDATAQLRRHGIDDADDSERRFRGGAHPVSLSKSRTVGTLV